ncbi:DNA adenine methylase [Corallococcus sp. CA054B]|uniref:DNA adenine methylase n=1 Tax=Corallococcus sp. CA054B TaxID=2316734 RepID=UPI000EA31141|nr:DNA adenine methylase [Corallococcus sp. CA054B]RKG62891.1 DNA adenine methylase [Corallococcus sp. CA054B]
MNPLRAPFPWFGGKSRAAHLVWEAFGDVANYVEPFAGSLAVMLGRPTPAGVETVNDRDTYLANFWRAVQLAPDEVARYADWPVNEADLHARHRWLVGQTEFRARMRQDPEYFDSKIAGWWVWGICQWIGSGWCAQPAWEEQEAAGAEKTCGIATSEYAKRPMLDKPGRGIHQLAVREGTSLANALAWEGRAHPGNGLRGFHGRRVRSAATSDHEKRPNLGRGGRGVHGSSSWDVRPSLRGSRSATGMGVHASGQAGGIGEWMQDLAHRLRYVRVCCGDWSRILSPNVTERIGVTGVLLDPPYSDAAGRDPSIYAEEDLQVAHRVREWALENGDNPRLRIALCGYEGEHEMPATWRSVSWKAPGGYAAARGNHENAQRERIWFSPHCLAPADDPFHGLPLASFARGAR